MVVDGITGAAVSEQRIQAVMKALDLVLDEPIMDNWSDHLRKLAIEAIKAARHG